MPYQHSWLIKKQVLVAKLWGNQTIEELVDSNAEITALLDEADNRLIHLIIDDAELGELPSSLFQIRKTLTYANHKNLGWVVVFGEKDQSFSASVKDYMILTLAKLTRARYVRVKTFEEAIEHLKTVDATLDWASTNSDLQAALLSQKTN